MSGRLGYPIQTYSGKSAYPLDPRVEDIDIVDIAHSLSMLCRFGGHSKFFMSVAQHSLLVSDLSGQEHALAGLLHDSAEALTGDMVTPLKRVHQLEEYRWIQEKVQAVIFQKWGLAPTMPEAVKRADVVALAIEARDVMGADWREWGFPSPPLDHVHVFEMSPRRAEELFLSRFEKLLGEKRAALVNALLSAREISRRALCGQMGLREAHELIAKGGHDGQ